MTPKSFKEIESEVLVEIGDNLFDLDIISKEEWEQMKPIISTALRQSLESYEQAVEVEKIHEDNEHPHCDAYWKRGTSTTAGMHGHNDSIEKRRENIKQFWGKEKDIFPERGLGKQGKWDWEYEVKKSFKNWKCDSRGLLNDTLANIRITLTEAEKRGEEK